VATQLTLCSLMAAVSTLLQLAAYLARSVPAETSRIDHNKKKLPMIQFAHSCCRQAWPTGSTSGAEPSCGDFQHVALHILLSAACSTQLVLDRTMQNTVRTVQPCAVFNTVTHSRDLSLVGYASNRRG
jgi:hypothetical protein